MFLHTCEVLRCQERIYQYYSIHSLRKICFGVKVALCSQESWCKIMDDYNKQQSDARSVELIGAVNETVISPVETDIQGMSAVVNLGDQLPKKTPISPLRDSWQRLMRDWRARASLSVLGLLVFIALVGPIIYQHIGTPYTSQIDGNVYGPGVYHTYTHEALENVNLPPSGLYWLGTDELGRDILARLMQGLLISIALAVSVEVFDILLGVTIGVLAGFFGGWIDQLLARFTDLIFAFPSLLFLILLGGIFGSSADSFFSKLPIIGANGNGRLLLLFFAIALFTWPTMARIVRGQTLQLKEQQFIEAARTSGTNSFKIMLRHIVPNLISIVVVVATINMVGTIVGEAGISLLGLGIQPPAASLGLMIADGARYIDSDAWMVLVPSITLALIVLSFSFLGDGLRDAFDPRSKN